MVSKSTRVKFGKLNFSCLVNSILFIVACFIKKILLIQLNNVYLNENNALPGINFMTLGLTVTNSVYQRHRNSVYQIIQFTKHYSTRTEPSYFVVIFDIWNSLSLCATLYRIDIFRDLISHLPEHEVLALYSVQSIYLALLC